MSVASNRLLVDQVMALAGWCTTKRATTARKIIALVRAHDVDHAFDGTPRARAAVLRRHPEAGRTPEDPTPDTKVAPEETL